MAQTTPDSASAPFVGQETCIGSLEGSLHEIPARATRFLLGSKSSEQEYLAWEVRKMALEPLFFEEAEPD